MKKYEKLKNKYDNLVKQTLEKNKQLLIDSFVEYYGEEYRRIIEKKYNEITFVYYIDWKSIDVVVKEFIPDVEDPNKYIDFINFEHCKNSKESFFSRLLKSFKKHVDLPSNLIGITNLEVLNNNYIKNKIFSCLKISNACSFTYGSAAHMDRIIAFQILSLTESTIIHEINHALTRDNMAYMYEENRALHTIAKTGLSIDVKGNNSGERNIEELINEKASREITKIFKQKGGDLSPFCYSIPFMYPYESNFYLVDEFYEKFKKYIKVARISDNKNALVNRVGKDNYEMLVELVNFYYSDDLSHVEKNMEEASQKVKSIIEKMEYTETNSSDISKEQLKELYNQLKAEGYNVRVLNNSSEESNLLKNNEGKKR